MTDEQPMLEGEPVGGWVLRAEPRGFDVAATLKTYGQVFWFPLEPSDRTALLAPGQPCYLYAAATTRVMGVWAVGEVVAPVLPVAGHTSVLAEVELLALAKPLSIEKLRADRVLADSELCSAPDQPSPLVLRRRERRALEAFDFEIVEPSEDQRRLVERALDGDPTRFLS